MNIQDKIIRHNRKQQKTTESKRAELSGPEAQKLEYEQVTKPRLLEQEKNMVDKYFQKLAPLNFGEYDVYQLVKKYEWNEKALDEVSNEKLRYKEESSHGDGWTEIRRTEKSQPAPKDRNVREGQKQRRNEKNADQGADNNDQRPNYKNRQQDRRRDNDQRYDQRHDQRHEQRHDQRQDNNQEEYQENRNRRADREYYQPKRSNQSRRNNYNQEPREENQQNQEPTRTEENTTERKESHNQQQDNRRNGAKRNNNQKPNKSGNSPSYGRRGGYEQFEYVRKEAPTPTIEKKPEEPQQQEVIAQTEQTKPSAPQERKVNPKINEPQPTPSDSRVTETKHKEEEKKEPVAHPTKQTPVKAPKEQHQTSAKKQEAPAQTHPINQQANTSPIPQQPSFGAPIVLPSMQSGPQFILPQTVDVKPLFPYPYTVFPLPNGSCHIVPFYLMMPPMMQMFPQFQAPQQPHNVVPQGGQSHQDPNQISQHQMSSFFSFPENGPKKN